MDAADLVIGDIVQHGGSRLLFGGRMERFSLLVKRDGSLVTILFAPTINVLGRVPISPHLVLSLATRYYYADIEINFGREKVMLDGRGIAIYLQNSRLSLDDIFDNKLISQITTPHWVFDATEGRLVTNSEHERTLCELAGYTGSAFPAVSVPLGEAPDDWREVYADSW